jgi:hypothetical protein
MTPVLICGHISLLDCDVLYDMPADIWVTCVMNKSNTIRDLMRTWCYNAMWI